MKAAASAQRFVLASILSLGIVAAWIAIFFAGFALFDSNRNAPDGTTMAGAFIKSILVPGPSEFAFAQFFLEPLVDTARNPHGVPLHARFSNRLRLYLPNSFLPLVLLCAISLVPATWCYLRQRRYSNQGAIAWALFVFLFGAPGLIGYLLHRRWPIMEKCIHCGEITPRDRDACLDCGTEFPLPALRGIEVFS